MTNTKTLRLSVGALFTKGPEKSISTATKSPDGEKPSRSTPTIAPRP